MLVWLVTGILLYMVSGLLLVENATTSTHFNESALDPILNISEDSVSWYTAIQSGDTLVNKDHISKHGWESIIQYIPEDEYVWIAARAAHTPAVSWEGCARWTSGSVCGHTVYLGGSIGDCIRHCNKTDHFLLLKGMDCRCVPRQHIGTCFQQTTDRCDTPCQNNPNDWCGGQINSMALYYTGPFNITSNGDLSENNKMPCVMSVSNTLQYSYCNSQVRRYICGGRSNSQIIDNKHFLTWLKALTLCSQSKNILFHEVHTTHYSRLFPTWTSIRRRIELNWTNESDERFPFCVSVSRDKASNIIMKGDSCEQKHRYLVLNSTEKHSIGVHNEMPSLVTIFAYVGLAAVLVLALSLMIGLLYRGITRWRVKTRNNTRQEIFESSIAVHVDEENIQLNEYENVDREGNQRCQQEPQQHHYESLHAQTVYQTLASCAN